MDAIKKLYDVDTLILVGTAGSDWLSFYFHLFESPVLKPLLTRDDLSETYRQTLIQLRREPHKMDINPQEVRNILQELKDTMGQFCLDIIVLKYGISEQEVMDNFVLLSKIAESIEDGDEISFDISYGFRSLALFDLLGTKYIQEVLGRNVKLSFISYGMFEVANDNDGYTPIIDLSKLVGLMDYIKAADEFNRFGTAILLSGLLADDKNFDKETLRALKRLGDPVNYSDAHTFNEMIKNCKEGLQHLEDSRAEDLLVKQVMSKLIDYFDDAIDKKPLIMARLAKWHFEHKRFLESSILIKSFMLSYYADLLDIPFDDLGYKEEEKILRKVKSGKEQMSDREVRNFLNQYDKFIRIRNTLAHGRMLDESQRNEFEQFVTLFDEQFVKLFINNKTTQKEMCELLEEVAPTI
jgi:CRISPR-associated Csx2 family protein